MVTWIKVQSVPLITGPQAGGHTVFIVYNGGDPMGKTRSSVLLVRKSWLQNKCVQATFLYFIKTSFNSLYQTD